MITREEALQAAIKYLGDQYLGLLSVSDIDDKLPEYVVIYSSDGFNNSWIICVPALPHESGRLGGGRIICISKDTGKILYDGSDGLG